MTIYTCLGMLIENLCHVGTMVCLLRRLGLLHVGFQLQNLQLQQHFSANIVQCLSTPVSGCDAVWDVCSVHIDMSQTQVTQQTPQLATGGREKTCIGCMMPWVVEDSGQPANLWQSMAIATFNSHMEHLYH